MPGLASTGSAKGEETPPRLPPEELQKGLGLGRRHSRT